MKRTMAIPMIAVMAVFCVGTWAQTGGTTAAEVLAKMAGTYSGAEKMSFTTSVKAPIPGMGDVETKTDVKIQRPNKFRADVAVMGMSLMVVSDGQNLYTFLPMLNTYEKTKAPEGLDVQAALGNMGGASPKEKDFFWSLMDKDAVGKFGDFSDIATLAGEESVNGVPCHRLKVQGATTMPLEVWIDKEKSLLRRTKMDMYDVVQSSSDQMGPAAQMFAGIKRGQMLITQDYTDYNLAPVFDAAVFKFTPPPGAHEGNLRQMMGGMGGGGTGGGGGAEPARPTRRAPTITQ